MPGQYLELRRNNGGWWRGVAGGAREHETRSGTRGVGSAGARGGGRNTRRGGAAASATLVAAGNDTPPPHGCFRRHHALVGPTWQNFALPGSKRRRRAGFGSCSCRQPCPCICFPFDLRESACDKLLREEMDTLSDRVGDRVEAFPFSFLGSKKKSPRSVAAVQCSVLLY